MCSIEVHGHRTRARRLIIGRRPRRTLVRALVVAMVAYVIFGHIFRPVWVRGGSMEPTIRDGTLRLVNLQAFRRRNPRRGDIVVIRIAGPGMYYLKRVLAVPGDRIRFSEGRLWLNGEIQNEPYVRKTGDWTTAEYTLDPGEYYVAGDNRTSPMNEHATGIADRPNILGALLF